MKRKRDKAIRIWASQHKPGLIIAGVLIVTGLIPALPLERELHLLATLLCATWIWGTFVFVLYSLAEWPLYLSIPFVIISAVSFAGLIEAMWRNDRFGKLLVSFFVIVNSGFGFFLIILSLGIN